MRVGQKYDEQFKAEAVALVRRGDRSRVQVATDLGINPWALRDWCRVEMAKRKRDGGKLEVIVAGESLEQRVARLERDNARLVKEIERLRTDRDILKKAAAFFAKESE